MTFFLKDKLSFYKGDAAQTVEYIIFLLSHDYAAYI